jgi:Transposase DDE domain group 1
VSATLRKKQAARKKRFFEEGRRRINKRLANTPQPERAVPMMTATNIHYEHADRTSGLSSGGIGAMLLLARNVGLIGDIDARLKILKMHLPYHESDHVLNIAFNILTGGRRIEHIELRRNDEVYLNALGAQRIPDPTTAGDFCRRFGENDVATLMDVINQSRLRVWAQQPSHFFDQAIIDADGTMVPTDAECKQGVDIDHDGVWGYHPLLISLANTAEPLYLVNRAGNRPSHEQAAPYLDKAIDLCRRAGFQRIRLRGDTDFSQTTQLDRWDQLGYVDFVFGMDARSNLKALADQIPEGEYDFLHRPPGHQIKTAPREKPERVKQAIVQERGFKTIHLLEEKVAEFDYRPVACEKDYRVIVLRKLLGTDQGQMRLFEEYRYFFYITNDRTTPAAQIVFSANGRCNQENLIAQLKSGVYALTTPVDDLVSNWAYMVMASLAWSLKAWSALLVPVSPRHKAKHEAEKRTLLRMEFATYRAAFIQMPCQIVRSGRRLIYRLLSWNPWQGVFLRLVDRLHECPLC